METNKWCQVLGIETPHLEAVKDHREAKPYSLLIVALLERGEAMTLPQVAARFAEAGVTDERQALPSLKRCRPGRAPVYRDGDLYHLDPHDAELDLWVFRLGLRPPRYPRLRVARPEPAPSPGLDTSLRIDELDEAWKDASLSNWSAQRLALAVLDAAGGPMAPEAVVSFVEKRARWHVLSADSPTFKRHDCPVKTLDDGRWTVAPDAAKKLEATRKAVRDRVEVARRSAAMRPDLSVFVATGKAADRRRAAHGAELAEMSRALLVGFPAPSPQAVALLDVGEHDITTYVGDELQALRERLATFDIIGAVEVRALLRALDYDPGDQRLAELGPPQKSKKLNKRGRTLKITTAMLIQGSCGISKPFGDEKVLAGYLANEQHTKLRRRLEADAKSLHALYEYGRLHGTVRLRWGFLDERIPAPWVHRDEPTIYEMEKTAFERGAPLEVVVGSAPGWSDPWSRAQWVEVEQDEPGWHRWLIDENGDIVDPLDVQLARIPER